MEQKDFAKKMYAGAFFTIGIFLIFLVILTIGMEKGMTQPKFIVHVFFREVGGLSEGAPARLSGVDVGTVGAIEFLDHELEGRSVRVTLNLLRRHRKHLEEAATFKIKTQGVLGDKFVEISKDRMGLHEKIDLTKPVFGEDPLDVQDLAETFGKAAVSLRASAQAINAGMEEVRYNFRSFKKVLRRTEQRLIEGNLFKVF